MTTPTHGVASQVKSRSHVSKGRDGGRKITIPDDTPTADSRNGAHLRLLDHPPSYYQDVVEDTPQNGRENLPNSVLNVRKAGFDLHDRARKSPERCQFKDLRDSNTEEPHQGVSSDPGSSMPPEVPSFINRYPHHFQYSSKADIYPRDTVRATKDDRGHEAPRNHFKHHSGTCITDDAVGQLPEAKPPLPPRAAEAPVVKVTRSASNTQPKPRNRTVVVDLGVLIVEPLLETKYNGVAQSKLHFQSKQQPQASNTIVRDKAGASEPLRRGEKSGIKTQAKYLHDVHPGKTPRAQLRRDQSTRKEGPHMEPPALSVSPQDLRSEDGDLDRGRSPRSRQSEEVGRPEYYCQQHQHSIRTRSLSRIRSLISRSHGQAPGLLEENKIADKRYAGQQTKTEPQRGLSDRNSRSLSESSGAFWLPWALPVPTPHCVGSAVRAQRHMSSREDIITDSSRKGWEEEERTRVNSIYRSREAAVSSKHPKQPPRALEVAPVGDDQLEALKTNCSVQNSKPPLHAPVPLKKPSIIVPLEPETEPTPVTKENLEALTKRFDRSHSSMSSQSWDILSRLGEKGASDNINIAAYLPYLQALRSNPSFFQPGHLNRPGSRLADSVYEVEHRSIPSNRALAGILESQSSISEESNQAYLAKTQQLVEVWSPSKRVKLEASAVFDTGSLGEGANYVSRKFLDCLGEEVNEKGFVELEFFACEDGLAHRNKRYVVNFYLLKDRNTFDLILGSQWLRERDKYVDGVNHRPQETASDPSVAEGRACHYNLRPKDKNSRESFSLSDFPVPSVDTDRELFDTDIEEN